MSDTFNHACDAFDSWSFDSHQDLPCKNHKQDHYVEFQSNPLYYHKKHKVELLSQTDKAFRFKSDKGNFWVAKKLCKKYKPKKGTVWIWKGAKLVYQQEEVKA